MPPPATRPEAAGGRDRATGPLDRPRRTLRPALVLYVKPTATRTPRGQGDRLASKRGRPLHPRQDRARRAGALARGRQATTLIRRVSRSTCHRPAAHPEEVDRVRQDDSPPTLMSRLVDRLLSRPSYGEHAARLWLDLARYADSSGYADDPSRTIWAYRDYVIRSFNANKPFDRFTIEQIAGDLLDPTPDETRIATAFHRNTMTNNEGGTNDEEFRNAAVVDRVNTTMAVWMGTTIACAQCHDHKYDPSRRPISSASSPFFNNTQDADRGTRARPCRSSRPSRKRLKVDLRGRRSSGSNGPSKPHARDRRRLRRSGKTGFDAELDWRSLKPSSVASSKSGANLAIKDDGSVRLGIVTKAKTAFTPDSSSRSRCSPDRPSGSKPCRTRPSKGPGHQEARDSRLENQRLGRWRRRVDSADRPVRPGRASRQGEDDLARRGPGLPRLRERRLRRGRGQSAVEHRLRRPRPARHRRQHRWRLRRPRSRPPTPP